MNDVNTICQYFNLGKPLDLQRIKISPKHKLWRVSTDISRYVIKQFPSDELNQINSSSLIAKKMLAKGIKSRTPLQGKSSEVFHLDQYYYQAYDWIEGEISSAKHVRINEAKKIGSTLGKIHCCAKDLPDTLLKTHLETRHLTHPQLIAYTNEIDLAFWQRSYLKAAKNIRKNFILSHGDLIQQNVIWQSEQNFYLIDWDLAGIYPRDIEVLGVGLNWSGVVAGKLDEQAFCSFWQAYVAETGYRPSVTRETIVASLGSWLAWLALNLDYINKDWDETIVDQAMKEVHETLLAIQTITAKISDVLSWLKQL